MKCLAVDDERINLELLVREIKKASEGLEVDGFLRPKEALCSADSISYDVAFLDIEMPQMTGIQLAKRLKAKNPFINIIFVTAYNEYCLEAMKMHASGYLLKPVSTKDIQAELENLRYDVAEIPAQENEQRQKVRACTFGQFDFYVNGQPVRFNRSKSKEMLAYLIDRHGAGVTKRELAAILFEDEPYSKKVQNYLGKIAIDLANALQQVGVEDIFIKHYNYYAVDIQKFSCDFYEYEQGIPSAINLFRGEYMMQYSWAENSWKYFE